VTVSAPLPPVFGPGPSGFFEATTATPYLGTSVAGKYAPTATDPVQGDISGAIQTYLAATNEPIDLATYVFPRGPTNITHVVANGFNVTAEQTVTIRVRDTTAPTVAVAAPADIAVSPGSGPINYSGKVGAPPPIPATGTRGVRAAGGAAALGPGGGVALPQDCAKPAPAKPAFGVPCPRPLCRLHTHPPLSLT
jgi:hypothetical protein